MNPYSAMRDELVKTALLAEAVRIGMKDIPRTPRLFMKARTPHEREVISRLIRKAYNRRVTQPLMSAAEKGISKLPGDKPKRAARAGVKLFARDPVGQLAANLVPVPGASAGYEGLKAGLTKLINVADVPASRLARAAA
jgi:hypothetical protein